MELVIASRNLHKVREFRTMLKREKWKLDIFSLHDFPDYLPQEEKGKTLEENAIAKAVHAAAALQRWVIADDSGLVVPSLGGAPGIFSARYAGDEAKDKENRKKLLAQMEHLQEVERQAFFECWIALASPRGLKRCTKGICEGTISLRERGSQGFGYDPLFVKHEYGKTFAELDEEIKNRVSHRRKALDKLLPCLEALAQD